MIYEILFLVAFFIGAIAAFAPVPAPWSRAPWICVFICIGILGLRVFAFR